MLTLNMITDVTNNNIALMNITGRTLIISVLIGPNVIPIKYPSVPMELIKLMTFPRYSGMGNSCSIVSSTVFDAPLLKADKSIHTADNQMIRDIEIISANDPATIYPKKKSFHLLINLIFEMTGLNI